MANVIPVVETLPADLLTPLGVYLKLSAASANSFLLESVEGGTSLARYSFIGVDPDFIACGNDQATTYRTGEEYREMQQGIFEYLQRHFSDKQTPTDGDLPSFIGGAIGYLGFSCSEWFEKSLRRGETTSGGGKPDATFMFFSSIVAFDHAKQLIRIISLVFSGVSSTHDDLQNGFALANARNMRIREILCNKELVMPEPSAKAVDTAVSSNWNRADFEDAVRSVKEMIQAGECYQVVLSQCFTRKTNSSAVAIYRALRSLNPSPYMFLLCFDEKAIVGSSPEMLVRCENDRIEYRPIAGTRHRGRNMAEDDALATEMKQDKKEIAEHLMLVDLGRNDLGRVAEFGSVTVDHLMSVEKYSHVQHLVSSLSARLRPGLDRFDALAACFPAGTVSGAPKVRAMEIIRDLEPTSRGIYAGAVGYFDYSGNMDTCIAIRTLTLENGIATIQAGAGIVADSVPAMEFEETVNKAKVLLKAIDIAEGLTPAH